MGKKKIIVAVDFSEFTEGLIGYAGEMANYLGAKVFLVHIIQSAQLVEILGDVPSAVPSLAEPGLLNQIKQSAQSRLERYQERLKELGIECEVYVLAGAPYFEIVEFAEKQEADLIIIGSAGKSGFKHLLLGSVAEKVARKSSMPMLIYKPGARKV